jgi:anaphase-promoting complex subunit 10
MDVDPPFDATGLKEIGNLASWTVSTYKPGCGVEALRDEDTNMFWQYVTLLKAHTIYLTMFKFFRGTIYVNSRPADQTDPNHTT